MQDIRLAARLDHFDHHNWMCDWIIISGGILSQFPAVITRRCSEVRIVRESADNEGANLSLSVRLLQGRGCPISEGLFFVLDKVQKVLEIINASIRLRSCKSVGALTRAAGRVIVNNSGTMIIGSKVKFRATHVPIELGTFPNAVLTIGDGTSINSGVSICAQERVTIGKNCGIGNYSLIMDTDFHQVGDFNAVAVAKPVTIGDDVWIGAHVTILKGVSIGQGAVVSAGSVVATSIPASTLYGGNPARFIKKTEPALADTVVSAPVQAAEPKLEPT